MATTNITHNLKVRVCDLPHGYFRERLTELVKDASEATVWVVARSGEIGDWAAYIGWPDEKHIYNPSPTTEYYCRNHQHPARVADFGDKLSYREARDLFPDMDALCPQGYRD